MDYLTFLQRLHERLQPATYLEIGVREGGSLGLSQATSVGIDPAFKIDRELRAATRLFRTTSDEYFSRDDVLAPFDDKPIDLAFIDGMHLSEFALRDFINVEKHSHPAGAIVFDDMLPRTVQEAARGRETNAWTGDVFKMVGFLQRLRPRLITMLVGTQPTGLLVVIGLEPDSTVLSDSYEELEQQCLVPDPQAVPNEILTWSSALDPEQVLEARFWSMLRQLREEGDTFDGGIEAVRQSALAELSEMKKAGRPKVPVAKPWPPRPAGQAKKRQAAKKGGQPKRPLWRRELSRVLQGVDRRIR
jgi:hypothetical protein